jgi:hypothetical protein
LHVLSTPPAFVLSQDQTLRECFPVIGTHITRAERSDRNKACRPQHPRCVNAYPPHGPVGLQRNHDHPKMDGVSTYLALTFGTLLSSQGTDASFVLTFSGFPPGASLRSCVSDSIRLFRVRFPVRRGLLSGLSAFRRFRLYQILSGLIPGRTRVVFPAVGPFRRPNSSGFPERLIIESSK